MANKGIRRIIELVLDAASARRMQRDAQGALDHGTDPTKAKRNLREVEKEANGLTGVFKQIGGALAAAFAIERVRAFATEMFRLGSSVAETQDKFRTVFGREGSAEVQGWIDQFGTLMGLSNNAARDMTSTVGAMMQGMGATQGESAKLSTRIVQLAGDLQSFSDVPIAETFAAIKSGLVGSSEPMMRYGIVITAADANTRALAETGKENEKQLTAQELAVARLNLMYERAGVAVGNAVDTQDSAANKARNLRAEYENLREKLALKLLPIFAVLLDALSDNRVAIRESAVAAWNLARVFAGALWASIHAVSGLLAGGMAANIGAITWGLNGVRVAAAGAALAWQQLNNAMGRGSADAVAAAREDLRRANADLGESRRLWAGGLRAMGAAVTDAPGRFAQVMNAGAGEGEFEWRDPNAPIGTGTDTGTKETAASRAADQRARDREEVSRLQRRDRFSSGLQYGKQDVSGLGISAPPWAVAGFDGLGEAEAAFEQNVEQWQKMHRSMLDVAQGTADGVLEAWSDAFARLFEEGANLGSFFENMARGITSALIGGVRDFAMMKAKTNVLEGMEAIAKAIVALSSPLTAAQAGGFFSGAARHFATAAGWGALAGTAAGGAGAVAGGGRGGGMHGYKAPGLGAAERTQAPGPEVHIHLSGDLSVTNPTVQKWIYGNMQNARERLGENATVHMPGGRGGSY